MPSGPRSRQTPLPEPVVPVGGGGLVGAGVAAGTTGAEDVVVGAGAGFPRPAAAPLPLVAPVLGLGSLGLGWLPLVLGVLELGVLELGVLVPGVLVPGVVLVLVIPTLLAGLLVPKPDMAGAVKAADPPEPAWAGVS